MKKIFLITLTCFLVSSGLIAQDNIQKITYHGQFRTLLGDYYLNGRILDDNKDTTSARRGSQGSMMFDLGIHCKPDESFKFLAEFRLRNVMGLDVASSDLSSVGGISVINNNVINSRMIFRQVRVEGNIKQVIQYQIGDIDLGLTKYTLYGSEESFYTYEADIFRQRRAIAHYETFQNGNLWRLQGVTTKTQFKLNKVLQQIDLNVFGTRTKDNDFERTVPNRFLVGGKLDITQSKYFSLGVNWSKFFDVIGSNQIVNSVIDTPFVYKNDVLSFTGKITPVSTDKFEMNILGEGGISSNSYFIKLLDTTSVREGSFVDAGLRLEYKPKKIELTASYVNVSPDFTSPGAQTLRLNPLGPTNLLGVVYNNTGYRVPTIFDRYASEFIYNQRIQTGLMMFLPLYGNVLPYGAATPNRSGIVYNLGSNEKDQTLSASIGGAMLSEIASEGDTLGKELRKFMQLKGGATLKVSKLIGYKRNLSITGGTRFENTTRAGGAAIDYKSLLLDGGLTFEFIKDLSLIVGVKMLHGYGTEVITTRNDFGEISGYFPYISDITQAILSTGLRIDLSEKTFFSAVYNNTDVKDSNTSDNYTFDNLFFNFTVRF